MTRLIGFGLFFMGLGMLIGFLITETILVILAAAICLMCGYHMFCR
ncbi:MAG: hypothetical protein SPE99_13170 [Blautia sp.]|nr:hypothetical protein [Blautia sp.]